MNLLSGLFSLGDNIDTINARLEMCNADPSLVSWSFSNNGDGTWSVRGHD